MSYLPIGPGSPSLQNGFCFDHNWRGRRPNRPSQSAVSDQEVYPGGIRTGDLRDGEQRVRREYAWIARKHRISGAA